LILSQVSIEKAITDILHHYGASNYTSTLDIGTESITVTVLESINQSADVSDEKKTVTGQWELNDDEIRRLKEQSVIISANMAFVSSPLSSDERGQLRNLSVVINENYKQYRKPLTPSRLGQLFDLSIIIEQEMEIVSQALSPDKLRALGEQSRAIDDWMSL
jgi:hypothetical protein